MGFLALSQTRLIALGASLVLILAVLTGCYMKGVSAGVTKDAKRSAPIIAKLDADLKFCNTQVDALTSSLEAQSAAMDAIKAESDERSRRAQEAIKRAQKQVAQYKAKADRIAAAKPSSPDRCEAARDLLAQSFAEDRK